ncbi:hypothetical protein IAU60_003494 [Kwoniella sp. DSM 27419]
MATKRIRSANAASMAVLAPDLPATGTSSTGIDYTISLVPAAALGPYARDTIFGLFDANMSGLQQDSSFPYTESSKREELFHEDTRYILLLDPGSGRPFKRTRSASPIEALLSPLMALRKLNGGSIGQQGRDKGMAKAKDPVQGGNSSAQAGAGAGAGEGGQVQADSSAEPIQLTPDQLLGFCSFRFDTEETLSDRDAEVAYCYELQLRPDTRGSGLGKLLISTLEGIGCRRGLDKVMLTCLKRNTLALTFYTKQGYTPDEIDPTRMAEEEDWADEVDEGDGGNASDAGGEPGPGYADEDVQSGNGSDRAVDYVILSKSLRA